MLTYVNDGAHSPEEFQIQVLASGFWDGTTTARPQQRGAGGTLGSESNQFGRPPRTPPRLRIGRIPYRISFSLCWPSTLLMKLRIALTASRCALRSAFIRSVAARADAAREALCCRA